MLIPLLMQTDMLGEIRPTGGSGYPVIRPREYPNRDLAHIVDESVREYYAAIQEADIPKAVKKEAAAVVKPYAKKAKIPTVAQVDWAALMKDLDAVERLIRIWQDEVDEEETILLMMAAP